MLFVTLTRNLDVYGLLLLYFECLSKLLLDQQQWDGPFLTK